MSYENCIEKAVEALRSAQAQLAQDIGDYPTPISACDAQFNGLLSDRARVANALSALGDRPFVPTPRIVEPGESPPAC